MPLRALIEDGGVLGGGVDAADEEEGGVEAVKDMGLVAAVDARE